MRQNNLSHHSSPSSSIYSASSTQIVESDKRGIMIESGLCSHFRDSNVPRWH